MKLSDKIKNELLTDTQIKRKVTIEAKKYIKEKGYNTIMIECVRGTFHVTNCGQYWLTAKAILEDATGLNFMALNNGMARLIPTT